MEPDGAYSNVAYSEVKNLDNYSGSLVYSVTAGQLPSHVRSVSPKCYTITDGKEKPTSQNTKRTILTCNCLRFVLLVTAFLITSCVAIYVSVFKFGSENQVTIFDRNKTNITSKHWPGAVKETINITDSERKYRNHPLGRTPCSSRCIPYSDPKFESQCLENYCECHGQNYQRVTCLPLIDDCIIKKQNTDTYLDNKRVSTFTCHVSTTTTNTHVISVYGNHFSRQTVVNLSGSQLRGGTIVLASHYPVRWKLKCMSLDVERVILVSEKQFGSRDLDMDCTSNNSKLPAISSVRVPFGYGDDRYGMDTVNMLKVIRNTFGEIKSFTGAEFADYINVKI